jgi:Rieske Fe-S protein
VLARGAVVGAAAGVVLLAGGGSALIGRLASSSAGPEEATPSLHPSKRPSSTTTVGTSEATSTTNPAGGGGSGSGTSGGSPTTTSPTTTSPTTVPAGTAIGPASDVAVGGAARFKNPANGELAFVVQPTRGTFVAFSAICTHAGCLVDFSASNLEFQCPCHGSRFSARTGAVLNGPAVVALPSIRVQDSIDGTLYADG